MGKKNKSVETKNLEVKKASLETKPVVAETTEKQEPHTALVPELHPPFYTLSLGLLLGTSSMLALVCYAYFGWYSEGPWDVPVHQPTTAIVSVDPSQDLMDILKNVPHSTILLLKPGTYRGNFLLHHKEAVQIRGQDKAELTFLQAPDGVVLDVQDSNNCILENVTIRGEDPKNPKVLLTHVENFAIRKCILESPTQALHVRTQSQKIEIANCTISGESLISSSSYISFTENILKASKENPALTLEKVTQIELNKNEIQGKWGIMLKTISTEGDGYNALMENTIHANKTALHLEDCRDFFVTKNKLTSEDANAINVLKCHGVTLGRKDQGNEVKTKTGHALFLSGSKNIMVMDGWYLNEDMEKSAVFLASCNDGKIWKNRITGATRYVEGVLKELKGGGITLNSSVEIQLESNWIYESQWGVRLEKQSEATLTHNKIEKNWGNGVEVENAKATIGPNNTIAKNTTGLVLKAAKGEIIENTILENKEDGILLENSSPKIQNNLIQNNSAHGLRLKNNSSPEMKGNRFIGNQGFGISFLQPGMVPWKADNIFEGNQKGLSDRTEK